MSKAFAFLTLFLSSYVLLLLGYSSHLMRYCCLCFLPQLLTLLFRIFSTLYFSFPFTLIGLGQLVFGSLRLPLKGSRRLT